MDSIVHVDNSKSTNAVTSPISDHYGVAVMFCGWAGLPCTKVLQQSRYDLL